jgi:hypothetical protein
MRCITEGMISAELQHFADQTSAKTNNRSVLGSLKEFILIGSHWIDSTDPAHLLAVSLKMATVPCTPLVETFPDRAVHALIATQPI